MSPKKNITIVGAGIVGLSTAYAILSRYRKIQLTIIEKESTFAVHQTGNNSGVIHSGIYYKPGSLKAINCKEGYKLLLAFARKHRISHEICGKIILASDSSELMALENIYQRGLANGLTGLKKLDATELVKYEPHAAGVAGIFVPQTGIIDYREVCAVLLQEVRRLGGDVNFGVRVEAIHQSSQVNIRTSAGQIKADFVVTCGGLYSDKLARFTHPEIDFQIVPFRGEYFAVKPERARLVKNLIYPVPDPSFPFLGVHFTRRVNGEIEAGPNAVLAYAKEGYTKSTINLRELFGILRFKGFRKVARKYWRTGFHELYRSYSKSAFTRALQKLVPEIQRDDLIPAGAGVRAQACQADGTLVDDFLILESERCIHVCNAPSPAATSSLAIGRTLADRLEQRLR